MRDAALHRQWKVIEGDVANVDGRAFAGVDLFAGGVPCPPFSIAGKQLGSDDERDLFPQALRLIEEIGPRAVLLENVRGLGTRRFEGTGRRCSAGSAHWAMRPGGTWCTRATTGSPSCGRGSCWWRCARHGRRCSAGRSRSRAAAHRRRGTG